MNILVLGNTDNTHGNYKKKLNIKDKPSFNSFLEELKSIHTERVALEGDTVPTKIIKTLESFDIVFKEDHPDMLIINNLQDINIKVFSGEKTNLEILLWITKGIVEEIADMIDDDIRHNGFIDIDFFCNIRDFILN